MAEVTYYVALPFVTTDDGVAAGEPTRCFNPIAVVMRAERRASMRHLMIKPTPAPRPWMMRHNGLS
jgi:hypothetical protein